MFWIKSAEKENEDRMVPLHQLVAAPRKYNAYSPTLNMEVPCIEFQTAGNHTIEWRYSPKEIKRYGGKSKGTTENALAKKRDAEYEKILTLLAPQAL